MCIAIVKKKDLTISKETLQKCFTSNPDGAGFTVLIDGKLHTQKGFFTFDSFWEAYEPLMQHDALIHFRIKTHGVIDEQNCHPFHITPNFAFIHNGTISGHGEKNFSDTYMFNEEILKPLVSEFGIKAVNRPYIRKMIEEYIGWSKLAFLDTKGNFYIFNESKGVWDGDVWYSNYSYKPTPTVVSSYSYGQGYSRLPSEVYYIDKGKGLRLDEGDYAIMNYPAKGLYTNDVVEIVKIYKNGQCDVADMYGKHYYGLYSSALGYYASASQCGI